MSRISKILKARKFKISIGIFSTLFLIFAGFLIYLYTSTPIPELNRYAGTEATIVLFSDGTEMGRFANENRIEIPLSQVPTFLQDAVFAAEDEHFMTQPAFSFPAIVRAFWNNLQGNDLQGGSTITQQYVKVAYLSSERSYSRKLRELIIAIKLEQKYSKRQILEKYLNTIYFGRGCYGVETAANQFFGKSTKNLSREEAIALASMIRVPGAYSPSDNNRLRYLNSRFEYVKKKMVENGWLTPEYANTADFPIFRAPTDVTTMQGPRGYILEEVRKELNSVGLTTDQIREGGLNILTTINPKYQAAAERAVLTKTPEDAPKDLHIGLAAIRPGTGEVLAIFGGKDYLKRQGITQAGSTFKVFTLTAALERGIPLSSVWDGRSPQIFTGMGEKYRVSNYGNANFGKISLLTATANSVNTVFVRLNYRVGPSNSVDVAQRAGIPESVEMLATPSFVLGVSSPHVIDVATAFATFAAQGMYAKTHFVSEVRDRSTEKLVYQSNVESKRVFQANVMADLTYALRGVVRGGTASAALGGLSRPAAGKTGTSQENASAWFSGYTPQLAASVAFFRDDATQGLKQIGGLNAVTGGSFPARIWAEFVSEALKGEPVVYFPNPAFIGGTRPIDLINPKPTAKPSTKEPDFTVPKPGKSPSRPQITLKPKPIPIPSSSPKGIP
jgi:membrane peptidoglycan carboxypeptidase